MKLLFLLAVLFWFLSWVIPREAMPATGCAYPAALDSFTNVTTGTILTAADYNKLMCAVESLEDSLRIPNFTVATRPASPEIGRVIYVTDAIDASTCNTGGGSDRHVCIWNGTNWIATATGGGGGAPTGASYITATSDGGLSAEFALGSLATGLLRNTTTTGIPTIAIEGTHYYAPGGTTIPLAGGGTGATTQAGAQTALAVTPGTNVFIQRTFQDQTSVFAWTNGDGIAGNPTPRVANSLIDGSSRFAADAGSSDSYVACPLSVSTMSVPAIADGSIHSFRANTANSGAATLDLCTTGARNIVKVTGGIATALADNDIRVGQNVLVQANNSNNTFQMQSTLGNAPAGGGGGTGTPGGATTECQFNDAGVFGGDPGCVYDKTLNIMSLAGGVVAGNIATNSVNSVMGGAIAGHRTYTWARNADMDYAGTTGTLTAGNSVKINPADASGVLIDGGPRYKTCIIENDTQSATVLTSAQITGRCDIDVAGTVVEIAVFASSGTPSVLLERWRPNGGSVADLLTGALATAAAGAYACSKTTAIAGIAGITCTNTLQNTTINAGDVIRVKSATAGGVATWAHAKISVAY